LLATPHRVAEAYAEFFAGVGVDPVPLLRDELATQDAPEHRGEIVLLRDIALRSICEHHLLPFTGVAHVAYLPDERLVGLGSIVRAVETLASRPQLQERLGDDIVAALDAALAPLGTLVVIDARHGCVTSRGSRQADSTTVTVAASGALADPVRRAEVMALIGAGVA
jgi:GTP cyclohydrolase I